MSFRDYHQRGSQPEHGRGLRVNTQFKSSNVDINNNNSPADTSKPKTPASTGLLYGKLRLVPSASYESSSFSSAKEYEQDHDADDDRVSLVHSSCSSASLSSQDDSASSGLSFSLNNHDSPPRRMSSNTPAPPPSANSRGTPGFSTQGRRRNRVGSLTNSSNSNKGHYSHQKQGRHISTRNKSFFPASPMGQDNGRNIRGWSGADNAKMDREQQQPFALDDCDHVYARATASDSFRGSMAASPSPAHHRTPKSSKNDSKYAELSTEVKHFQKMVAQLESLIVQSADSPEAQWRGRILVRSAQEADRDIADKLYEYEKSLVDTRGHGRDARTAQTACMKLHRDYRRVHKALNATLQEYERRQRADISLLGGAMDATGRNREGVDPALILQQEQEDFFERAVREREEEMQKINQKMHTVNEIYQELAALVEGQQENIDAVEENVQDAKAGVEGGLRHIEYARDRLCAMGDEGYETPQCGGGMGDVAEEEISTPRKGKGGGKTNDSNFDRLYPSSVGETEVFHWSMPFQTFHKDIKSVQKDIFGIGNDFASFRCGDGMRCGSLADINQCGGKNDHSSIADSL